MNHRLTFMLLLATFLIVVTSYHVKRDDKSWDYMVFTQTWPKASCIKFNHSRGRSCTLNPKINQWTIHGIWPNNAAKDGPFYCQPSWKFDEKAILDIEASLDLHWPNIIDKTPHLNFWKHEWEKHGTCAASLDTLNSEHKYFQHGIQFNTKWNLLNILGAADIKPSMNQTYKADDIKTTIEKTTNSRVNVGCIYISDFDYQLLVQVEICLDKQFNTIDCDDMRDKLMFNPSKGTYIFPCHGDSDVRYVPFSE